jgi:hypothetical protein
VVEAKVPLDPPPEGEPPVAPDVAAAGAVGPLGSLEEQAPEARPAKIAAATIDRDRTRIPEAYT